MITEIWLHRKSILRRGRAVVNIDIRLKAEDVQILQSIIGSILNKIEHDEFMFSNTSSQVVKFVLEDSFFYLYSFTEELDYFGAEEDVAVWSVEKKELPFVTEKDFVSTPIKEKVTSVQIVQEHQELFENNQKTYDVWVTRGIIIDFEDHELAFEKPIWFSEDIVIRKGYNLIEKFQPVEEICKAENWKDGVKMLCSREVITL